MKLNLRHWRKERGLTLEAVAEQLDISHGAVSRWESGARLPSLEHLMNLAKLYGVEPGDLFEPVNHSGPNRAREIAKRLSPSNLETWLAMGAALAEK